METEIIHSVVKGRHAHPWPPVETSELFHCRLGSGEMERVVKISRTLTEDKYIGSVPHAHQYHFREILEKGGSKIFCEITGVIEADELMYEKGGGINQPCIYYIIHGIKQEQETEIKRRQETKTPIQPDLGYGLWNSGAPYVPKSQNIPCATDSTITTDKICVKKEIEISPDKSSSSENQSKEETPPINTSVNNLKRNHESSKSTSKRLKFSVDVSDDNEQYKELPNQDSQSAKSVNNVVIKQEKCEEMNSNNDSDSKIPTAKKISVKKEIEIPSDETSSLEVKSKEKCLQSDNSVDVSVVPSKKEKKSNDK